MIEGRPSWVRKVTVTNLENFTCVLRTPVENDAKASATNKKPAKDKKTLDQIDTLFGGSSIEVPYEFHSRPILTNRRQGSTSSFTNPVVRQRHDASYSTTANHPARTKLRWYKRMGSADAQRPPGKKSNPTGHLTLVQFRHPIDHATWFRNVLFVGQAWEDEPFGKNQREVAFIPFHITMGGEDLGEITLRVAYTPKFGAGQGNRTTTLHWGQVVGNRFKKHDYTKFYVTIERTTDDAFVMVIDHEPNGDFMG